MGSAPNVICPNYFRNPSNVSMTSSYRSQFLLIFFYSSGLRIFYLENIMVMYIGQFFSKENSFGVFLHVAPQVVFRSPGGEN
jgi:hypothetical protein